MELSKLELDMAILGQHAAFESITGVQQRVRSSFCVRGVRVCVQHLFFYILLERNTSKT